MHEIQKKTFENERKIERHSFFIERQQERRTSEKLSASGAQNFRLSASSELTVIPCVAKNVDSVL